MTRDTTSHNFFLESLTDLKGVIFIEYDFSWDRRCRVGGREISRRVLNKISVFEICPALITGGLAEAIEFLVKA